MCCPSFVVYVKLHIDDVTAHYLHGRVLTRYLLTVVIGHISYNGFTSALQLRCCQNTRRSLPKKCCSKPSKWLYSV